MMPNSVGDFPAASEDLFLSEGGMSQPRGWMGSPPLGAWQYESQAYLDRVIVLTALDFRQRGGTRFIGERKRDLLRDFDQLEILITESALRVHLGRRPPPLFSGRVI